MADRVGQQLGNYRLTRLLGKGGFAEVYLAEHMYLKTQAAIKLLSAQLTQEDLQSFQQEAQRIAHLEHPHIVRILDFGVEGNGNTPFLVMSYAPGRTLRMLYPPGKQMPLTSIVVAVQQIASALQYAHDHQLIHRDVKPENLLVGRNNEILVSDFGIAAVAHSTTSLQTQAYSGTIHYSAPEQIAGKPRPASDQYALGIAVYEWLCGNRPFRGDMSQLVYQHLTAAPPPFKRDLQIPSAVEQVVMTALAKEPQQRFANVQAFATALERASQIGVKMAVRSPARPATVQEPLVLPVVADAPRSGEWTMFGFNAQHTHFNPHEQLLSPSNVARLVLAWTASTKGTISSSPAVTNGLVYVGSEDHKLYAFEAATGQMRWSASTEGAIVSSPAVANGLVYVGSNDSKLYAFEAVMGQLRWSVSTREAIGFSSPVVADRVVYIGSGDSKQYAFEAATGQLRWSAPTGREYHLLLVSSDQWAGLCRLMGLQAVCLRSCHGSTALVSLRWALDSFLARRSQWDSLHRLRGP
jgi:serine/threonine protein kinase